ncbi:MAG: hypothetical protein IT209_08370 [Armatimonadetes bacterium]|nr:hypothetical protein [Armatimonadota bacterium]
MNKYLPLFVAGATVLSVGANAARVASVPITHQSIAVYQAYPGDSNGTNLSSKGYLGAGSDVISAVPGVLSIEGGANWENFVGAAKDGIPHISAGQSGNAWSIKNVVLQKTTPPYIQCSDVFPVKNIPQQGTANIRTWWPLMYDVPGTNWTLTILYGTTLPYDDDGAGPNPPAYVHQEVWKWHVDATLGSIANAVRLFHELPFGLDEVPLISDECLYPQLLSWLSSAEAAASAGDTVSAGLILGDFELGVMDACIGASPAFPSPTGPGTGIANTLENPACCKLLVDIEYVTRGGIFQPNK